MSFVPEAQYKKGFRPETVTPTKDAWQQKSLLQKIGGTFNEMPTTAANIGVGAVKEAAKLPFQLIDVGKNIAGGIGGLLSKTNVPALQQYGQNVQNLTKNTNVIPKALESTNQAQQVGSTATQIGEFMAPTGLAKATTLLPKAGKAVQFGLKAGEQALEFGIKNYVQTRDAVGSGVSAALGGALPVVGSLFTKAIPQAYKLFAQTFSGAPGKAIDLFVKDPVLGKQALQKAASDETMIFQIAETAQKAIDEIQKTKTLEFTQGLIKNKADKIVLDSSKLMSEFQKVLEQHGLIKNGQNLIDQVLPVQTEIGTMGNIIKRINNQKSFTVNDILTLKQFLQDQYGNNSGKFNKIIQDLGNVIHNELPTGVKEMLKKSGSYEVLLQTIKSELGISRGSGAGSAIEGDQGQVIIRQNTQKIINSLRRAFAEKSDLGPLLLQQMEKLGGKQMLYDIAAQFFKSTLPPNGLQSIMGLSAGGIVSALGAIANPATLFGTVPAAIMTGSPKVVGNMSILAGKLKDIIGPISSTIQKASVPLFNKLTK